MSKIKYPPEKIKYLERVRARVNAMSEERRNELDRRVKLYENLSRLRTEYLNG